MLSYSCKIAIKSVIYLATKYTTGEKASIKEIAENIDANEHTVGKLLQTLVKQHVIKSIKGPAGGFYITDQQLNQSIIQIVNAIDGNQIFKECGLGLSQCSSLHPCPIHTEYQPAREMMENLFKTKTIIELCKPVNLGSAYLFG